MSQPLMSLIFANLTQAFVAFGTVISQVKMGNATAQADMPAAAASFRHRAAKDAAILVYIGMLIRVQPEVERISHGFSGIATFVCTFVFMYIWVHTGEVNAKRLRERYLQAILRQDIAFFDDVGAGEVATRIQTDTRKFLHAI